MAGCRESGACIPGRFCSRVTTLAVVYSRKIIILPDLEGYDGATCTDTISSEFSNGIKQHRWVLADGARSLEFPALGGVERGFVRWGGGSFEKRVMRSITKTRAVNKQQNIQPQNIESLKGNFRATQGY